LQCLECRGCSCIIHLLGRYKGDFKCKFWEKDFTADLVLAEPEIAIETIGAGDFFVLLACDGLWDVMSNQEAVDSIRKSLQA
jgi:serine/threonine protein phosphatase PrpC